MSAPEVKQRQVAEITTTCANDACPKFTTHGVWKLTECGKSNRHVLTCAECGRERPLENPDFKPLEAAHA